MARRSLNVRAFVQDLHQGIGETDLMVKYELTASELQQVLRRMIAVGYVSAFDVTEWLRLTDSQIFKAFRQD